MLSIFASFVEKKNGAVLFYNREGEAKAFELIRKVKNETGMLLKNDEAYTVYSLAKKAMKIEGDIAEVGVYRGGSARLILDARGSKEKSIYLFDTFEGLPALSKSDNPLHFAESQFPASFEEVKKQFASHKNVFLYKGLFPSTAAPIESKKFAFVNLDTDLYESTKECLEFFYPRMNCGGIILTHDYPKAIGVKKAFDEFFERKEEIVLEAPSRQQGFVIKL